MAPANEVTTAAPFTRQGLIVGARELGPLLPSVLAVALLFGVLASQAMSVLTASTMSVLAFTATAQLVAVTLWSPPLPVITLIFSTAIVSLRNVLLSATLHPWLSRAQPMQAYLSLATLNDASWAITLRYIAAGGQDRAYLLGAGLAVFVVWVLGSVGGALAGARLPDPTAWGLDYAFPAGFLALLWGQWQGRANLLPWLTAGVVAIAVASLWPGGSWHVLAGGLAGAMVAVVRYEP